MGMVSYNQGLVEFADSKAGSLILLNSLLIAAIGALPATGNLGVFKLLSVALCSTAVYFCFQVIISKESAPSNHNVRRKKSSEEWEKDDYLFFGCISRFKSGADFCRAFERSSKEGRIRALLHRTFVISEIAERKFGQYKTAQYITSIALAVWVLVNLVPFVTSM